MGSKLNELRKFWHELLELRETLPSDIQFMTLSAGTEFLRQVAELDRRLDVWLTGHGLHDGWREWVDGVDAAARQTVEASETSTPTEE